MAEQQQEQQAPQQLQQNAQGKPPYKILWYSVPALHDNSNGAAIHSKIMLEALAARGMEVKVLNALVADDLSGLEIFERISKLIEQKQREQHPELEGKPLPDKTFLQFIDNKVEYFVVKTRGHLSKDVTTNDQHLIFDLFVQLLEKFQPDVVMGYSGDFASAYARLEAQTRGIPCVYALHNGLHRSFSFPDCDLVFSPSEATAKMYRDEDGTDVKAVGQFIDRAKVTVPPAERKPSYITLINPTPEKGLAIFVKLAQVFAKRHPEQKFLVVKSVGNYQAFLAKLHYKDGTPFLRVGYKNPVSMIDVAEHTDDVRQVYALTKVLVTPSVWHESWGCVATEAVFNNIPVLSSKSGGLSEAIREGGVLLDAPQSTQADFFCVPSTKEIMPWVEALEQMLSEDWTERCAQASAYNDLEQSLERLMVYLQPILEKGQQHKHPLTSSFCYSDKAMARRCAQYEAKQAKAAQAETAAQSDTAAAAQQ